MSKATGWIGVDLDGTLAYYDQWRGETHIGEPIPAMAERVKKWLSEGKEVRIFTARAWNTGVSGAIAILTIKDWAEKHFGQRLEVTCMKDYNMVELWDDRAVQVIPNTGMPIAEKGEASAAAGKQAQMVVCPKCSNGWLHGFDNPQAE